MEPDSERRISPEDVVDNLEYIVESVDWSAVWDEAPDDEELLAWPLLPKGRQVALYGEAKSGKSLLALELVVSTIIVGAVGLFIFFKHFFEHRQ